MITTLKKALCILIQLKQPQFVLSHRYFNTDDVFINFHRTLFLASIKTPRWVMVQLIAWMRWMSFETWKLSYRVACQTSAGSLQQYQLTRLTFFCQLVRYGLLYQLSPRQYIRYQFYRPSASRLLYHYVFDHQLPWFHHVINRSIDHHLKAANLIADKYAFYHALKTISVPTVTTMIYSTLLLKKDPAILFQKKSVFCKPNQGAHSIDCFLIQYHEHDETYTLESIHGTVLKNKDEIQHFLEKVLSRQSELLIQDYLVSHASLHDKNSATTTVRIITGRLSANDAPSLLYLQLEVATDKKTIGKKRHQQCYDIIPLHLDTLEEDPVFIASFQPNHAAYFSMPESGKILLRSAIAFCLKAHHRLLSLMSVAFDVILTPNGPFILEANYNWAISVLYHVIPIETFNDSNHPAAVWLKAMIHKQ